MSCKNPRTTTYHDVCTPRPECAIPKNVDLLILTRKPLLKLLLHTHPNSDELHLHLKFSFVPSQHGGVEITKGTVTLPLNLQTLSEKIRFDLHDQVTVEFVSGQEITV